MFFSPSRKEVPRSSFLSHILKKEGDRCEAACLPRGEEVQNTTVL